MYTKAETVYPAHAGIDPERGPPDRIFICLPRTRGDRPQQKITKGEVQQSTPHTRGSTCLCLAPRGPKNVYPAHAGIDPRTCDRAVA